MIQQKEMQKTMLLQILPGQMFLQTINVLNVEKKYPIKLQIVRIAVCRTSILLPDLQKMKMKEKLPSVFSTAISLIASVPVRLSKKASTDGNSLIYSVASTKPLPNSPLKGKTVIFLGSSVTFGSASKGESFVEFLAKRDGIKPIKEAVSGTTLVDNGPSSYISRMKTIDKNIKADAFICRKGSLYGGTELR